VWDVDGNEFLDMTMAVGPLVLGYCHPAVDEAIRLQLEDGITFSLPHPLEVEVAEAIREAVPGAEAVRFSKTGADVTSAAIRLARAFTGRDRVVCCGYHGWHDWHIAVTDRSLGIPGQVAELTSTFEYGDLDSLDQALDQETACVILEPTIFDAPPPGFLEGVRERCDRNGSLLVFDEMWTGFRLALGGAQERFGVRSDLATFSKAVANGMPLSVLTGRADVMKLLERDVFFFTTFGGEALSLAAAKATLAELKSGQIPALLEVQGREFRDGYNAIAADLGLGHVTSCRGFGCRSSVSFDSSVVPPLQARSLLQQEMIRRGVLWNGSHNISAAHSGYEVDFFLSAARESLVVVKSALASGSIARKLEGLPVEPVFRKTSQFNTRPRSR
jgi:glutamate-1-semialdehyde aminotransferase